VELVDVLVWVLDPEKYADAAVHDRYLAPLSTHAGALLVVLNQVDRLDPAAAQACEADLRRLLDGEGLDTVPIQPLSARTGSGVAELRGELARRVAARRAATDRLTADVRAVAADLAVHTPDAGSPGGRDADPQSGDDVLAGELVDALSAAAGVAVVRAAVERSEARAGAGTTGWPLLRWVRRLRPDPLGRLHLGDPRARTSLPPAGPGARAAVATAVRGARDAEGAGLPQAWREELRRTVVASEDQLADRLDQAVAGVDLGPDRTPLWQRMVGGLQWSLALVALVGALWLLALVVLGFFRLDGIVPLPRVQEVPLPTLLLIGGLLAGLLLAVVSRPLVALRARRRGRAVQRRVQLAVEAVAEDDLLAPMRAVREDAERFGAAVEAARR
jgi:hypothetical protein